MPQFSGLESEDLSALVSASERVGLRPACFESGSTILEGGVSNSTLYVILDGEAELFRTDEKGIRLSVCRLGRGAFLGLLSFWTGYATLCQSVAASALNCLPITREELDRITSEDPEFSHRLHPIFIANLCSRYRSMVDTNLKVASLGLQLESERNELRATVEELKRTRLTLVHRERLATMGQLVAGIAHEINNPGTALQRGIENLEQSFLSFFAPGGLFSEFEAESGLIERGCASTTSDTEAHRLNMEAIAEKHPNLKRSLQRRLAYLDDDALAPFEKDIARAAKGKARYEKRIEQVLECYELGTLLRTVRVSGNRMLRLVRSLKSYGRSDAEDWAEVDIGQCIRDTVAVMQYRLKRYDLRMETPETSPVQCLPGEVNQVITNLLSNACDATPEGGTIGLHLSEAEKTVCINVFDTGCGFPAENANRIFEPNFTTKGSGGAFGLGLGLAISREIAKKHGGTLSAKNRAEGGATFEFILPKTQP